MTANAGALTGTEEVAITRNGQGLVTTTAALISAAPPIKCVQVVTGDTVTVTADAKVLLIMSSGVIADLHIELIAYPEPDDIVDVAFNKEVTTLTVRHRAQLVEISSAAIDTAHQYRYVLGLGGWCRWR